VSRFAHKAIARHDNFNATASENCVLHLLSGREIKSKNDFIYSRADLAPLFGKVFALYGETRVTRRAACFSVILAFA